VSNEKNVMNTSGDMPPNETAPELAAQAAASAPASPSFALETTQTAPQVFDSEGDEDGVALITAPPLDLALAKRVIETAILTTREPLPVDALTRLFEPALPIDTVRSLAETLRGEWHDRGVELVLVATGYRFQARPEMQAYVDRLEPDKAPRYSRAIMETLAIIAYRQPTTRGEIESIRGVAVSSHVIKALEDREWVEVIGHKESTGRPALYATTKKFLNDLGLRSLSELPALADLDEHPALELPDVPTEPPFPQQARLDADRDDGQTMLELPIPAAQNNDDELTHGEPARPE
jgi:segregation and condensation protein B